MTDIIELKATDLAAMLCSRVCHDLINPVGAIGNGLEVLADPTQGAMAAYLFRNVPAAGRDDVLGLVREQLAPGGWLVVQDYSVAGDRWATLRWHLVSWLVIIPLGLVADRNPGLYRYLWRSVLAFDDRRRFGDRLAAAGFVNVAHRTASGWQRGILHTFVSRKPG